MTATFCRLNTDQTREPIELENLFAGPALSSCWMIGGGPSLNALPSDAIRESPVPKMCINLSGTKLMRPTFWTSYDPSARFHRSVYLDPGVMKFVHRRRAMDLVPAPVEVRGVWRRRDGARGRYRRSSRDDRRCGRKRRDSRWRLIVAEWRFCGWVGLCGVAEWSADRPPRCDDRSMGHPPRRR